jgi:hypothetical protein
MSALALVRDHDLAMQENERRLRIIAALTPFLASLCSPWRQCVAWLLGVAADYVEGRVGPAARQVVEQFRWSIEYPRQGGARPVGLESFAFSVARRAAQPQCTAADLEHAEIVIGRMERGDTPNFGGNPRFPCEAWPLSEDNRRLIGARVGELALRELDREEGERRARFTAARAAWRRLARARRDWEQACEGLTAAEVRRIKSA